MEFITTTSTIQIHTSMAAVFMAHQVQLQSKALLLIALLLSGCDVLNNNQLSRPKLNADSEHTEAVNGILLAAGQPFSGQLFKLYPHSKDTFEISSYLNGKEHGAWRKYYAGNRLMEIRHFVKGKKEGEYLAWWVDGTPKLDYHFANDEYEGTCKEWNREGTLIKVMNYKAGYEEGQQRWWYDNGKIKANYIMRGGRRYGLLGTKNCVNVYDNFF